MCETKFCLLLMNEDLIKTDKAWYCGQRVEDLDNTTMTVNWGGSPWMTAENHEDWTTYAKRM
jgi:hypothetical protein